MATNTTRSRRRAVTPAARRRAGARRPVELPKAPTGIAGFDEITGGGLPRGRPTLVCGSAGCGKTLFGMEFLVRGARDAGDPGIFVSFEERVPELAANVASLGFDLDAMVRNRQLVLDHVRVERAEIEETGEYDLEALFIRIGYAADSIGAKRIVLDTIESLFAGLGNPAVLRAELRRLFAFLKERGLTAVITGERGDGQLTRHGLEEYVSDCVILLDHRVYEQISTRRLRVVKYRGSSHGTNEYPFLIDRSGIIVLPVTAASLQHAVSDERVSTGVAGLDEMLGGRGFYRGSSILITGTAGTGKSSLAAHFADATCRRGERCAMFLFEESPSQVLRNMQSIGLDLGHWVRKRLLTLHAARPTLCGLELHLAQMHRIFDAEQPTTVIVDPVTNLLQAGRDIEVQMALLRLVDALKARRITGLFTSLVHGDDDPEESGVGMSSMMDAWILLRDVEADGERNRILYLMKSRGMAHSNQVREFRLTDDGAQLVDAYLGPHGVLTGSARLAQEMREREEAAQREEDAAWAEQQLARKRTALRARIAELEAELGAAEDEARRRRQEEQRAARTRSDARARMAESRQVAVPVDAATNGRGR